MKFSFIEVLNERFKVAPARWAVSMRGLLGCIKVLL